MPVGSHYFSWWYWYSIITYAYRHYFSGAINMCCDLGALDLNLTHMFITGWSMFQKCHLCIFPNRFGVTPILDSPTKDKENFFFSFFFWNSTAHWPSFFFTHGSLWPCWLEGGSHGGDSLFALCLLMEKYGVATENMPFFIFLLLVTRYAWDAVIIAVCAHVFFVFQVQTKRDINWKLQSLWNRQSREKLPVPSVIQ